MYFPGGSDGKESACNAGHLGSNPESGRSPGEGNGNPLQYSCLENPMDRGAWRATVHGVAKSWIQLKQLSMHALAHQKCWDEIEALHLTSHLLFHLQSWLVSGCHS